MNTTITDEDLKNFEKANPGGYMFLLNLVYQRVLKERNDEIIKLKEELSTFKKE